jgi:hypothetical protein
VQSAKVSENATNAAPEWHFHSYHYDGVPPVNCVAAGEAQDLPYKCEKGGPVAGLPFVYIYLLYLWY